LSAVGTVDFDGQGTTLCSSVVLQAGSATYTTSVAHLLAAPAGRGALAGAKSTAAHR
jgi:hypothetical protein